MPNVDYRLQENGDYIEPPHASWEDAERAAQARVGGKQITWKSHGENKRVGVWFDRHAQSSAEPSITFEIYRVEVEPLRIT